jgi:SAM-dependent methyltransferase
VDEAAWKRRQADLWSGADYPAFADRLLRPLGRAVVDAAAVRAGERVLDVAAGAGNATLRAAERGAHVVASDLSAPLLEVGRERAAARGLTVEWQQADAEAMPFPDGAFDVVISAVGAIMPPHHQAVADELVRVLRPGGRLALANWRPGSLLPRVNGALRAFAPPPPPGTGLPEQWGEEAHVRALFRERVTELTFAPAAMPFGDFTAAADVLDFFKRVNPLTTALYARLPADQAAAADTAFLIALGPPPFVADYVVVTAIRPDP